MPLSPNEPIGLAELVRAAFVADNPAPPCFYWTRCGRQATLEKAGRTVCRPCSATLRGAEYPLRNPCTEALYASDRVAAEALDMLEETPEAAGTAHLAEESNVED